jgi:uncharacterized membrane protein YkvA (DUF1232 family)
MFARFKLLAQLWNTARLAWRLVRDPRVPLAAKLILGATAVYLGSPIDVLPDWIPGLGQADDIVALLAGLNVFIRACPRWIVDEHRRDIDRRGSGGRSESTVVEGEFRRVG